MGSNDHAAALAHHSPDGFTRSPFREEQKPAIQAGQIWFYAKSISRRARPAIRAGQIWFHAKSFREEQKPAIHGRTDLVLREVHFAKSKTGHPGRTVQQELSFSG